MRRKEYCNVYKLMVLRDYVDRRNDISDGTERSSRCRRFRPAFKSVLCDKELLPEFRIAVWDKLIFLFEDSDRTRFLRVAGEMEDVENPDPWPFHTYMGKVGIARAWVGRRRRRLCGLGDR